MKKLYLSLSLILITSTYVNINIIAQTQSAKLTYDNPKNAQSSNSNQPQTNKINVINPRSQIKQSSSINQDASTQNIDDLITKVQNLAKQKTNLSCPQIMRLKTDIQNNITQLKNEGLDPATQSMINQVESMLVNINCELDNNNFSNSQQKTDAIQNGLNEGLGFYSDQINIQKNINDNLQKTVDQTTADLLNSMDSTFANLSIPKKTTKAINCIISNNGFGPRILYENDLVKLIYTLEFVDGKGSSYTDTKGDTNYFCGFKYNATYELVNKKSNSIGIVGFINGRPGAFSTQHLSPNGQVGKDFGFDKNNDYWQVFYFVWNGMLAPKGHNKFTSSFWTETPNEEPAWQISATDLPLGPNLQFKFYIK
jgi:hypothetical protein